MNNTKIAEIINSDDMVSAHLTALNGTKRTVYFKGTPKNIALFLSMFVFYFSIRIVDKMDLMLCETSGDMMLIGAQSKLSDEIRRELDALYNALKTNEQVEYVTDKQYAEYCRNEEK